MELLLLLRRRECGGGLGRSTLRYANRAKNIQNKPKINEDPKDTMLREFQEEIARLKSQLTAGGPGVAGGGGGGGVITKKVIKEKEMDEDEITAIKEQTRWAGLVARGEPVYARRGGFAGRWVRLGSGVAPGGGHWRVGVRRVRWVLMVGLSPTFQAGFGCARSAHIERRAGWLLAHGALTPRRCVTVRLCLWD